MVKIICFFLIQLQAATLASGGRQWLAGLVLMTTGEKRPAIYS